MTSGKRNLRAMATLWLAIATPTASWCGELDPVALIRELARPAPATTAFTEIRYSPLLDQPTVISGELSYLGPNEMQRRVLEPYRERTIIRGESVRMERDGESPRTFSLRRAPELKGLLMGFSALLAGEAAALQRDFELSVTGERTAWVLQLLPRDARARSRLRALRISGANESPRCFAIDTSDQATSIMILEQHGFAEETARQAVESRCGLTPPP